MSSMTQMAPLLFHVLNDTGVRSWEIETSAPPSWSWRTWKRTLKIGFRTEVHAINEELVGVTVTERPVIEKSSGVKLGFHI